MTGRRRPGTAGSSYLRDLFRGKGLGVGLSGQALSPLLTSLLSTRTGSVPGSGEEEGDPDLGLRPPAESRVELKNRITSLAQAGRWDGPDEAMELLGNLEKDDPRQAETLTRLLVSRMGWVERLSRLEGVPCSKGLGAVPLLKALRAIDAMEQEDRTASGVTEGS